MLCFVLQNYILVRTHGRVCTSSDSTHVKYIPHPTDHSKIPEANGWKCINQTISSLSYALSAPLHQLGDQYLKPINTINAPMRILPSYA